LGGIFGHSSTISHEDPRINALQIQQSTYGGVIPVVFGTNRIAGNLLDYVDFTPIAHTTTQSSGGKGGGGVTQTDTTYTYTVAAIIGLCEGSIVGVGRVWKDKDVYQLAQLSAELAPLDGFLERIVYAMLQQAGQLPHYPVDTFYGNAGQQPWNYMVSKHPERALYYPRTAYVASAAFDLGSNASMPNFNFEVIGRNLYSTSLDANPKDIITAILSDLQIGVGFPAKYLADLTMFSNYCIANGVLFSPSYTSQDAAQAQITNLCQAANSEPVWSQGQLKIVPYSLDSLTANGVTYTPPPAPVYDLTIDDFVYQEGEPPVKVKPNLTADRYNIQPVEIMNRNNDYNVEPIKATDDPNISAVGPRQADSIEMHFITTPEVGQFAAQSILQRQLYVPKQYEVTLTWRHCLLDPMDVVTITELDFLGLDHLPVRVVEIDEGDDFNLVFTVEDCPEGVHSPALYSTQSATRPSLNYNTPPGDANPPVIFEPPVNLTDSMTIGLAASGSVNMWGGCGVWVSYDGETYKRIGAVKNPARQGFITQTLPSGYAQDVNNTLAVDLSESRGQLMSASNTDAANHNTLCWVDGEVLSYQTATLTDQYKYNLMNLARGLYGSDIADHAANSKFVRLDDAVFTYAYKTEDIGKTIYIKLTSFNVFNAAEQSLNEVEPYTYTIKGSAPIDEPGFTVSQSGSSLVAVIDKSIRDENNNSFFTYELRMGATWDTAIFVARFTNDQYTFDAPGEGTLTFWLKAIDSKGNYSANAGRALVNVIGLPARNIIAETDEDMSTWQVSDMYLDAAGRYRIEAVKVLGDYARFADIFSSPIYLKSDAEILFPVIDLGPNILDDSCFWVDSRGNIRLKANEKLSDYTHFADIFGATLTFMKPTYTTETFVGIDVKYTTRGNARIDVEYKTSLDGLNWSGWIPSSVQQFTGRYVQIHLLPRSTDNLGQVFISGAHVAIDVPDVEDIIENVSIPAQVTRIAYQRKFAQVKSVSPYTQDLTGKQATCNIVAQTNEYFDIEIMDQTGNLISGKLQRATIRGY
jgi:hypothetical protein